MKLYMFGLRLTIERFQRYRVEITIHTKEQVSYGCSFSRRHVAYEWMVQQVEQAAARNFETEVRGINVDLKTGEEIDTHNVEHCKDTVVVAIRSGFKGKRNV
jgi:hypothetical protein